MSREYLITIRTDSFYFSCLKNAAACRSCGWELFLFKFRRCKNMQMQQYNLIIILIQKSMALWEPCSGSYINRTVKRNIKCSGGLLHMLSLILFSHTLLKHRSNSAEINTYTGSCEGRLSVCQILWSSQSGKKNHLKCFRSYIHLKCSAEPVLQKWYFLVFFEALSQLNHLKYIITEAVSVTARANVPLEHPLQALFWEFSVATQPL